MSYVLAYIVCGLATAFAVDVLHPDSDVGVKPFYYTHSKWSPFHSLIAVLWLPAVVLTIAVVAWAGIVLPLAQLAGRLYAWLFRPWIASTDFRKICAIMLLGMVYVAAYAVLW